MEADQNIHIFADGTFRMRLDNLFDCRARIQLLASHSERKAVLSVLYGVDSRDASVPGSGLC